MRRLPPAASVGSLLKPLYRPAVGHKRLGKVMSIRHRRRSVPHLGRKSYHCLMGLLCVSLYAFALSRTQALWLLGTVGGFLVLLDWYRIRSGAMNALTLRLFGKIMRREELKSISGNSFYILGIFIVLALFSKPVVLLSVLFLAIGDPVAGMVGTLWGRHKLLGDKSAEGAAANFLFTGAASFLLGYSYLGMGIEKAWALALVGGTVSTVSELIPFPLDDNFTIPVFSAILLTLVTTLVPLF
jgi:glycerol-3-phosphate acyltransferase PlsY